MSYTTQEFASTGLTALYPAYYKEFQIINWTSDDIVITESNGKQIVRPKCPGGQVTDSALCVIIEYRSCDGMRIDNNARTSYNNSVAVPLKAMRYSIPYQDIKQSPVKVEEFNIIISTVEQAMIAKNMMCEITFGQFLVETSVDARMCDPRFVFQVIDPNNEFEALFVNAFGQTVIVRAGRFSKLTNSGIQNTTPTLEHSRLICYLRYPTDMYTNCKTREVVFDITLDQIYSKEPFRLPSGDYICVAVNMADLQEILSKKAADCNGNTSGTGVVSDKMIPKDVFDAAEINHKDEVDRLNNQFKQQLATLKTTKDNKIAELESELATVKRENEANKAKTAQWEKINEANAAAEKSRQEIEQSQIKTRKEAADAVKRDIDNMWTVLKISATALASITSFAVTLLLKSKK